jgi:hypothetical protein
MSDNDTVGNDNQNSSATESETQNTGPNLGAIRKSGQMEVLNVLAKVSGQTFNSTKDAATFLENLVKLSNTHQTADSEQSTQVTKKDNKSNSETAELRQMILSLQSDLAKKDTVVRQTTLQSQIKDVAVRTGFDPSMLDIATNLFESQIAFDDNGSFYVKGKDGNVRLDSTGNPMGLDQLAKEILKSRPKLAVDEVRTGTGAKFGFGAQSRSNGDIPDASLDMAGYKAWKQANGIGGKSLAGVSVNVGKNIT